MTSFSTISSKIENIISDNLKTQVKIIEYNNRKATNIQCSSLDQISVEIQRTGIVKSLILKQISKNGKIANLQKFQDLFYNEIMMYEFMNDSVSIQRLESFLTPRYYGSVLDLEKNTFLLLDDLTAEGYEPSRFKQILPDDHIEISLKLLGQYHGNMYLHKLMSPLTFEELVANIRETRFKRDSGRFYFDVISFTAQLGIVHFRDFYGDTDQSFLHSLKQSFADSFDCFQKLIKPSEPISTLCHGDLNQNNILFRYDDNSDSIISAKIIDLQTPRYASPAIDLSFFLCMHTSGVQSFDRYFDIYYNTIRETVKAGLESQIEVKKEDKSTSCSRSFKNGNGYSSNDFQNNYGSIHIEKIGHGNVNFNSSILMDETKITNGNESVNFGNGISEKSDSNSTDGSSFSKNGFNENDSIGFDKINCTNSTVAANLNELNIVGTNSSELSNSNRFKKSDYQKLSSKEACEKTDCQKVAYSNGSERNGFEKTDYRKGTYSNGFDTNGPKNFENFTIDDFDRIYSRDAFLQDYRTHACFGYLLSSMFFVVNRALNPTIFLRETLDETLSVFKTEILKDPQCLKHNCCCLKHVIDLNK